MKKIIILLFFLISFTYAQTPRWHFRMVIKPTSYNGSYVFDFNDTYENEYRGGIPLTLNDGSIVVIGLEVNGGTLTTNARSTKYHTIFYSDYIYRQANYTNYATHTTDYNIDIYMRYDPDGTKPFTEHDRLFQQVKFIDINGNGLVNLDDLYKPESDAFAYPSQLIYFSDNNGDGNADSGELFNDEQGISGRTQSAENIPIRDGLGDTDGDGTDEDEDEDPDEEENEINLDDKLPGLDNFKNIVGLDSINIPSSTDPTFTINLGFGAYSWEGIASVPYINKMRVAFRDLLILFFTWLFIKQLVTTFRQW